MPRFTESVFHGDHVNAYIGILMKDEPGIYQSQRYSYVLNGGHERQDPSRGPGVFPFEDTYQSRAKDR